MTDIHDVQDRIEAIRRETIALVDRLIAAAREQGLPEPPRRLVECRQDVAENSYTVLVAGEAKRGKSSFVNALIGRPMLPVDVQIATSQVFRVRNAAEESFRVRYEDGSAQEIAAGELDRYGNQAEQVPGQSIRLDRMIRWIEVDTPARFLPSNITVLDSPGLGSLFGTHAEVTHRVVPFADAVIFALDSSQPVTAHELEFVDTILDVTRHILFIQTKIDQFGRNHWRAVQQRNEEILAGRFGDRLTSSRVWPIGSHTLMQGAEHDDEDFVIVSRHGDLAAAVREFLFRIAGSSRIADALDAAAYYIDLAGPTFESRLHGLEDRSRAEREALLAEAGHRRRQFEDTWGERSPRRLALARDVTRTGEAGFQQIAEAIATDGPIAESLRTRIEALDDIESLRWMGEKLGRETVSAVMAAWNDATAVARQRYLDLLQPFTQDTEAMARLLATGLPPDRLMRAPRTLRAGWIETLPAPAPDEHPAVPLMRGALDVLMLIGMVAPPLGIAASAASLAWSAARNVLVSDTGQIRNAKAVLQDHLDDALDRIAQHFLVTPVYPGTLPLAASSFAAMEATVLDQVAAVANQASLEAEGEIARLEGTIDERREAALAETQRAAAAWHAATDDIARLVAGLAALPGGTGPNDTLPGVHP